MRVPVKGASEKLGVSVSYLRRLIRRGRIHGWKVETPLVSNGWYYEVDLDECQNKRIGKRARRA
jgi:transposase